MRAWVVYASLVILGLLLAQSTMNAQAKEHKNKKTTTEAPSSEEEEGITEAGEVGGSTTEFIVPMYALDPNWTLPKPTGRGRDGASKRKQSSSRHGRRHFQIPFISSFFGGRDDDDDDDEDDD